MSGCTKTYKENFPKPGQMASGSVVWNGNGFSCLQLPNNPSLNDVIQAIGNLVCNIPGPSSQPNVNTVLYTPQKTLGEKLDEIDQEIKDLLSWQDSFEFDPISDLKLGDITPAACFTGSYTTGKDLLEAMMQEICLVKERIGRAEDDPDEVFGHLSQDTPFTIKGGSFTSSGASLTVTLNDDFVGVYDGSVVRVDSGSSSVLVADRDNYIYAKTDGSLGNHVVNIGDPTPPLLGTPMRMFTTDANGVVANQDLRSAVVIDVDVVIGDEVITGRVIRNGSVTSSKLQSVIAAGSAGLSLIKIDYNDKGQIIAAESNIEINLLASNHFLQWDNALQKWVNKFFGCPSMDETDRDALGLGAGNAGSIIFNSDNGKFQGWTGSQWDDLN